MVFLRGDFWELLSGRVILQVHFMAHNFTINSHFPFKHLSHSEQGFTEVALGKIQVGPDFETFPSGNAYKP